MKRRVRPAAEQPVESIPEETSRPSPRRSYRAGQVLFGLGAATVLMALGSVAGYWLADAGTRWLPQMMGGLLAAGMLAVVFMIAGMFLIGPYAGSEIGRKRIVALTVLLLGAGVVRVAVHWASEPKPLTTMTKRAFYAAFERDTQRMVELGRTLGGLTKTIESRGDLFDAGDDTTVAAADMERFAIDVWTGFVHTAFALDHHGINQI